MSLVDFSQIKGGKQLQDNVDKKANITDVYNVDGTGKKTALYRKNTDKIVLEDLDKNQILTLYNAIPEESDEEMKKYVNLRDLKITSRDL